MGRLTKAQEKALSDYSDPWVVTASPYQLGIQSRVIGNLLKSGLIEQFPSVRIVWDRYTRFRITGTGRQALSESLD